MTGRRPGRRARAAARLIVGAALGFAAIVGAAEVAVSQQASSRDVEAFGAKCDGASDDSAAFAKADAGGSLLIAGDRTCAIGRGITIAHPVVFSAGAKLSIPPGTAVTLDSDPVTPLQTIFSGGGMVRLPSQRRPIYAEWWGAAADNKTDSAPAFQAAANALTGGGTIEALAGNYKLGCASADAVTFSGARPVSLQGAGANITFFRPGTNCNHYLFAIAGTGQSGNFRDFAIYGSQLFNGYSAAFAYNGIDCEHCGLLSDISRIVIVGIHDGLNLPYFNGASVNSVEVQYFTGRALTIGGGALNANGAEVASLGSFNDVSAFCYVPSFTGTLTAGANTITGVSNFAGIVNGMFLFNQDIPASPRTTVVSFDPGARTITLSAKATGTAAGTTIAAQNGGPNGALGIVIDSGANEMKFDRLIEAGCERGLQIQNTSPKGHRPEGLRFYTGGNINNNWDFDIGLLSGNEIEMHGMASTGAENGPSFAIAADDGHCAVDGVLFEGGIIAGAAEDGLSAMAGCNVTLENSVIIANGYSALDQFSGIHIGAGSTGSWHIAGNQFGPNMWGNLNNTTQAYAIAVDRAALGRYAYANYFGAGPVTFDGRLFIDGNDFGGCCGSGVIDDASTPAVGNKTINNAAPNR